MRVVHIAKVKGIAGAERHLIVLLPGLASRGCDVRMLVLEEPGHTIAPFRDALEEAGVPVTAVTAPRHVAPGLVRRLAGEIGPLRPDIVHTHMFHADVYGLRAATRVGVRAAVSTRHDNSPFRRRLPYRWLTRQTMQLADRVITISDSLAGFVAEVEGVDRRIVVPIHYGLPAREAIAMAESRMALSLAGSQPVVGVVARLVEQKGVDVLIDAFPRVRDRHPGTMLLIAGDGPERTALECRAAAAGLGRAVRFIGWTDRAPEVMSACHVVAMPSRWEGFGLAALEAMSCGRPVVASDVDALREIVRHGETGLLVPAEDPGALADALNAVLSRPEWGAVLGAAGRCRAQERFPADRMVASTLAVYRQLCDTPPFH